MVFVLIHVSPDDIAISYRGMVYVIAHIRGGGEMGRYWYEEQRKYLNKRNTFSDFINCAEHLVESKVTNPDKLSIEVKCRWFINGSSFKYETRFI